MHLAIAETDYVLMRVLGLIPARGGSKGVPRKNTRLLCGKPLIAYTAEAALASTLLERVVLSTEDDEIADLGRRLGVDVPFLRPVELACDQTPTLPVLRHALVTLSEARAYFDAICVLEPTSPMRTPDSIDDAIRLLVSTGADTVVSVMPVPDRFHPHRVTFLGPDMLHRPAIDGPTMLRRQDRPAAFCREGSIYLTRSSVILEQGRLIGDRVAGLVVPEGRAVNIDTIADWELAERMLCESPAAQLEFPSGAEERS